MTGGIAIRARGLRKVYRIYRQPLDALLEAFDRRGSAKRYTERVALDGVDLELHRGEIIGVLGRNGAGKSTLLKLIAGTLDRTAGDLEVDGRITAILELGTGFHPEYSGRENIYMGGLCLGMTRAEIDARIDQIIEFSELREVIDQPFKTYSTGMQARLTFSTAISVNPDILIVDEALSVGDARFQQKCFGWIKRLRERNATVLLVSHDSNTITTFCDRALILEQGRVFAHGNPKEIAIAYHNLLFGQPMDAEPVSDSAAEPPERTADAATAGLPPEAPTMPAGAVRYGTGEAELVDWGLYDTRGQRLAVIETGAKCRFSLTFSCRCDIADLSGGFAIKDRKGTCLWGITNLSDGDAPHRGARGELVTIAADCTMWLANGDYFVTLGIAHQRDGTKIDFIEDAIGFSVLGPGNIFTNSVVNLDTTLTVVTRAGLDAVPAPVHAP